MTANSAACSTRSVESKSHLRTARSREHSSRSGVTPADVGAPRHAQRATSRTLDGSATKLPAAYENSRGRLRQCSALSPEDMPGPCGTSTADCGESRFRSILCVMADPLIEREEIVALLFNVRDIASALERIERLLEEDDGEEEADES